MKEISPDFVKTAKIIDSSPEGALYEIDDETVVQVYDYQATIQEIEQEKANAKNAVRIGIPTLFSFDVVKIGDNYGIIYENVQSKPLGELIMAHPENFDKYVTDFSDLCHSIHRIHVGYDAFRPAKGVYSGFGQQMVAKGIFTQEENNSVLRMLDAIPEQDTFILSALRTSSVRYFDDELTIYGLRSACYGHPIYDLGGTSLGIWTPGILGDDDGCKWSNGMDCATSLRFWDAFIVKYFDCPSEEDAAAMAKRVNFAGFLTHYIVPIFFHMGGEDTVKRAQDSCRADFFPHIDEWIADMSGCWERFL